MQRGTVSGRENKLIGDKFSALGQAILFFNNFATQPQADTSRLEPLSCGSDFFDGQRKAERYSLDFLRFDRAEKGIVSKRESRTCRGQVFNFRLVHFVFQQFCNQDTSILEPLLCQLDFFDGQRKQRDTVQIFKDLIERRRGQQAKERVELVGDKFSTLGQAVLFFNIFATQPQADTSRLEPLSCWLEFFDGQSKEIYT